MSNGSIITAILHVDLRSRLIAFLSLAIFTACNNPLAAPVQFSQEFQPGILLPSGTPSSPFAENWDFDFTATSSYDYDPLRMDFTGGSCRLSPASQTDANSSVTGFGGGTSGDVAFDSANSYLRLSQTSSSTNTAELDSSWAPKYSQLVGYWKFNGAVGAISNGTTLAATVGSPGLVTTRAAMAYTPSKFRQGISVSPGNDIFDIPSPLIGASAFTISFWVNLRTFPSAVSAPITIMNGGGMAWELFFNGTYVADGEQAYSVNTANVNTGALAGSEANTIGIPQLNSWRFVTLTYDSTASPRSVYYVDGVRLATAADTITGPVPTHDRISVGGLRGDLNTCCHTNGSLDELAVWNTALNPTDVKLIYSRQSALYSGAFTSRVLDAFSTGQSWTTLSPRPTLPFMKALPGYSSGVLQNESSTDYPALVGSSGTSGGNDLQTGLVGLWHLDEAAGASSAVDSSPYQHAAAASGGTTFGTPGMIGTGLKLNGSNGHLLATIPELPIHSQARSYSVWFKTAVPASSYGSQISALISQGDNSTGNLFALCHYNLGGQETFGLWGSSFNVIGAGGVFTLNEWHLGTVTYDGTTTTVYLDGKAVMSGTPTLDTQGGNQNNLSFGYEPSGYGAHFPGTLDEVSAWNRVLHPNEVQQLYRRGANRLKYQVRTCTQSDCSDDATGAQWKGTDGTNQTYFSELNNSTAPLGGGNVKKGLPAFLFSDYTSPVGTSRYFQYRAILESDDAGTSCDYGAGATWCSPELRSVTVDPVHYDSSSPTMIGKNGVAARSLSRFVETLGTGGCASGVSYNLGVGSTYATAIWYWWDATARSGSGGWVAADGTIAKANSATVVSSHAGSFITDTAAGTVFFKAYLKSTGLAGCELDHLLLEGVQ